MEKNDDVWVCVVDEESPALDVRAETDVDAAVKAAIRVYKDVMEYDVEYEALVEVSPKIGKEQPARFHVYLSTYLSATPRRLTADPEEVD